MKKALLVSILSFILCASFIHAKVGIEIIQGVDSARPIGVIPFHWTGLGTVPEDIAGIIAADLRNSGQFNPIKHLPPQTTNFVEVTIGTWTALGVDYVVIGKVQPSSEESYMVSYQLVDVVGNNGVIITENQYKVSKQWLRYAAHTASDEIFEKIMGIKGAFRTRIAYVLHTGSSSYPYELCISDYDGYNQTSIYRSPEPLMSPAWSPDGRKLAYVTFESGQSALVVQTLENGAIFEMTRFPQHNGAPAWSPDGKQLAFALSKTGSLNLYVLEILSGKIRQVTHNRCNNTEPSWFPDNQTLAYTSDQGGRPQIYKININDGNPQRITWNGYSNQDANVSVDGKFIVMVSQTENGAQHIVKINLITGIVQVLTDTFLDETPRISPNGTMVIYSTSKGIDSELQFVSINGNFKARFLSIKGKSKFPAWSPYL